VREMFPNLVFSSFQLFSHGLSPHQLLVVYQIIHLLQAGQKCRDARRPKS
jgi:hypothetical protein